LGANYHNGSLSEDSQEEKDEKMAVKTDDGTVAMQ